MNMECRILANPQMINPLALQILLYNLPLPANPGVFRLGHHITASGPNAPNQRLRATGHDKILRSIAEIAAFGC
jgi:hypothetical protein